jgi:hypothetical protein
MSHWVTAVIIMGAVLVVVAEGSYLEWKDADELRRKTEAVLKGVQAELEAARRPAVSPPPALNRTNSSRTTPSPASSLTVRP